MANFKHISIDGTSYDAVPADSYVTGVKGSAESAYRTGNVNLSKTNVGLGNVPNVTTNNQTPTFAQASTRDNLVSGEKLSVLFGKIMKWFADLKTVAFSGSYTDLSDQPTIPTVNDATLTIQKNGTNVQTFTANASANKTANITVPTKVSELTNDSGYTTNTGTVTQVKVGSTAYNPSSGVVSLPAYPTVNNATLTIQKNGTNVQTFTANANANKTANITVPTKTSELTNDSGFITNAGVTGVKGNSESSYRTGNVNITKANIGLSAVGNFKAVSTAASQGLTATEQLNARTNVGLETLNRVNNNSEFDTLLFGTNNADRPLQFCVWGAALTRLPSNVSYLSGYIYTTVSTGYRIIIGVDFANSNMYFGIAQKDASNNISIVWKKVTAT